MIIEAFVSQLGTPADDFFRFADVEEPLAIRAEAMVTERRQRGRHHRRGGETWTLSDEAMFRTRLGHLYEARARLIQIVC